jgi:hypothetical protein
MRRLFALLALLIVAYVVAGVSRAPRAAVAGSPAVIVEVADPSLVPYALMWQREIARRFPNAVGILVHGGDVVEGQWIVGTSYSPWRHSMLVSDLVRHYQRLHPDRTIVLLTCNPGHIRLRIPGVYYATSDVWCVPDRELTEEMFTSGVDLCAVSAQFIPFPVPVPSRPRPTRAQLKPDNVGNVFEFIAD